MYKDLNRKREYQKQWVQKRKSKWFSENGPCVICGSSERLELDHINPETKVTNSIWSWSEKRRSDELIKCQILCYECHKKKTAIFMSKIKTGISSSGNRKLTPEDVILAKEFYNSGMSYREIGKYFNIDHSNILRRIRK